MSDSDRLRLHNNHIGKWTRLLHAKRNVAVFCSTGGHKFPSALQLLVNLLVNMGVFPSSNKPNHILINEYKADEGILPHTDGISYLDRTATISIGGGDVLFKFKKRKKFMSLENDNNILSEHERLQLILEVMLSGCGSLILFCKDAYTNHLHSIDDGVMIERSSHLCANLKSETVIKRGYRVSLTFRHKYESDVGGKI